MAHVVDPGYQLLAAKYLRRQAKQLAEQFEGVRAAEDIEFVHRARVATRRLRAALRMFDDCFPARRVKQWRKAIRRITAELGDARDCDVQIDLLCGVLSSATSKACFPGIARLLVHLEHQRERLQRKVVKAIKRLEADNVLCEVQRMTKDILAAAESAQLGVQSPAAYAHAEQHILRRWDDLRQQEASLADADDQQGHHAMRIATKRLRYTVEIVRPVYAERLEEPLEAIKRVQTLLGEIHDCDVWLEHLDEFAARERKRIVSQFGHAGPFARLHAGIEYLRQDRRTRRRQVFDELAAYWAELGRQAFWEHLVATVRARGAEAATAQPGPVSAQPGGNGHGEMPARGATMNDEPALTSGS